MWFIVRAVCANMCYNAASVAHFLRFAFCVSRVDLPPQSKTVVRAWQARGVVLTVPQLVVFFGASPCLSTARSWPSNLPPPKFFRYFERLRTAFLLALGFLAPACCLTLRLRRLRLHIKWPQDSRRQRRFFTLSIVVRHLIVLELRVACEGGTSWLFSVAHERCACTECTASTTSSRFEEKAGRRRYICRKTWARAGSKMERERGVSRDTRQIIRSAAPQWDEAARLPGPHGGHSRCETHSKAKARICSHTRRSAKNEPQ
jgi:hypothetical protein